VVEGRSRRAGATAPLAARRGPVRGRAAP
jgi:hypothetical protein